MAGSFGRKCELSNAVAKDHQFGTRNGVVHDRIHVKIHQSVLDIAVTGRSAIGEVDIGGVVARAAAGYFSFAEKNRAAEIKRDAANEKQQCEDVQEAAGLALRTAGVILHRRQ